MKRRYALEANGVSLENLAELFCKVHRVDQSSLRFFLDTCMPTSQATTTTR